MSTKVYRGQSEKVRKRDPKRESDIVQFSLFEVYTRLCVNQPELKSVVSDVHSNT
jgi:hypothetical protein